MASQPYPSTGLWKKVGKYGTYYNGKVTITEPGEYWLSVDKANPEKYHCETPPELHASLKPVDKDAAPRTTTPPRTTKPDPDDDIPF